MIDSCRLTKAQIKRLYGAGVWIWERRVTDLRSGYLCPTEKLCRKHGRGIPIDYSGDGPVDTESACDLTNERLGEGNVRDDQRVVGQRRCTAPQPGSLLGRGHSPSHEAI